MMANNLHPADFQSIGVFHFDPSSSDNVTLSSSDVSNLTDLYNGYDASQGTASKQPLYDVGGFRGKNGIYFDKTASQVLGIGAPAALINTLENIDEMTLFAVSEKESGQPYVVYSASDASVGSREFNLRYDTNTTMQALARNEPTIILSLKGTVTNGGTTYLHTFRASNTADASGDKSILWQDNSKASGSSSKVSTSFMSNITGNRIGANVDSGGEQWWFDGYIGEIIMIEDALSDAFINEMNVCLMAKWPVG